jgi:hypothetical protein
MFVVRGDLMRDSLGNPAKPAFLMYDGNGNPVTGFAETFFLTDSNAAAHFNAEGVLAGDRLGTVHLVGQVGTISTTALLVAVTVAPTKITAPTIKPDTIRAPAGQDTLTSIGFLPAAFTVRGVGDTTVQGVVVHYTLVKGLGSLSSTQPSVYLADDQALPSLTDTTDAGGVASRRVVVVSTRLSDQTLLSGQTTDSVIVEARAKYKGVELAGSPVRLVFPVKVTFALR